MNDIFYFRSRCNADPCRLSLVGVGSSGPKWFAPFYAGEDIVCAHVKAWGVRLKTGGTALDLRSNVKIFG